MTLIGGERRKNQEKYITFLAVLGEFYISTANIGSLEKEFVKELRLAWLYGPGDIIRKGNAFFYGLDSFEPVWRCISGPGDASGMTRR